MPGTLPKILVIEDEKLVREALVRKLTTLGFNVVFAADGEEGLKKAEEELPALVLLDLILPVMDGLTVLENIRSADWGKSMPVIVLSNLSDAETVTESKKHGVFDYLVKTDWSLEDVVKKIKTVLKLQ